MLLTKPLLRCAYRCARMAFGSSARPRTTFSETVEAQEAHGGMFDLVLECGGDDSVFPGCSRRALRIRRRTRRGPLSWGGQRTEPLTSPSRAGARWPRRSHTRGEHIPSFRCRRPFAPIRRRGNGRWFERGRTQGGKAAGASPPLRRWGLAASRDGAGRTPFPSFVSPKSLSQPFH